MGYFFTIWKLHLLLHRDIHQFAIRAHRVLLTVVFYSLAEQHTHRVDNTGGGGAVDTSAQRQQKPSLEHKMTTITVTKVSSSFEDFFEDLSSPVHFSAGSPTASRPDLDWTTQE